MSLRLANTHEGGRKGTFDGVAMTVRATHRDEYRWVSFDGVVAREPRATSYGQSTGAPRFRESNRARMLFSRQVRRCRWRLRTGICDLRRAWQCRLGSGSQFVDDPLQIFDAAPDVLHLLGPGDFALNGDRAGVAVALQNAENSLEIDQAAANGRFLAQSARVGRPAAILGVDGAHVFTEDLGRIDGIGLAVENHVGGVEADAHVVEAAIADGEIG